MAASKATMHRLINAVSETITHMVHGGYDEAWDIVLNADKLHFFADERSRTLIGVEVTLNKPKGVKVVIDTIDRTVTATVRQHIYKSRIFADNAGYLMAASDIFANQVMGQRA